MSEFLSAIRARSDIFLDKLLTVDEFSYGGNLAEAMRYSVLNNGKRLRPALVFAVGNACGIPYVNLDAAAASVELIHCYSLVHDDLPAMDDDDLRRGKPSCHKQFNEATAILAGDALQSLAFEVLADPELNPIPAEARAKMVAVLAKAIGNKGMVLGQDIDMASENKTINLETLKLLHKNKTGALFMACIELALCAANTVDITANAKLTEYGQSLGLAFQIQDDILDVTATTKELGKPCNSDVDNNKSTFVSLLGLEKAKAEAEKLYSKCKSSITSFNERGLELEMLAKLFIERTS